MKNSKMLHRLDSVKGYARVQTPNFMWNHGKKVHGDIWCHRKMSWCKCRSLVKFEELAKGTIGESTQSAIMYRLEIWLNEKQELFLTSRTKALSRGCVREKPVSCAWELCVPGEKSHCIAWENWVLWDTGYVSQSTPSIQSWNKDHKRENGKRHSRN